MDPNKIFHMLGFLISILHHNFEVVAIRCLACDGLLEPWHCTTIRNCPSGHRCGIKQFRDLNQNLMYDLDCFPNLICDSLKGKRHISNSSEKAHQRSESDVTTCASCCNGDFCNSNGCGSTGYPANRGPVCFQCNEARDPGDCDKLNFCRKGQKCAVMKKSFFGQEIFSNDCILDVECVSPIAFGRKRNSDSVVCKCCNGDFCNLDCNGSPDMTTSVTVTTAIDNTPSTDSNACSDSAENCAQYPDACDPDGSFFSWAKVYCRKTCNLCTVFTESTTTKPSSTRSTPVPAANDGKCEDKVPNCYNYGDAICEADFYIPFRNENCRKYCGLC